MPIIEQEEAHDIACRQSTICAGCGKSKDIGSLVCWACFKGGENPFKFFNGSLKEWLELKAN